MTRGRAAPDRSRHGPHVVRVSCIGTPKIGIVGTLFGAAVHVARSFVSGHEGRACGAVRCGAVPSAAPSCAVLQARHVLDARARAAFQAEKRAVIGVVSTMRAVVACIALSSEFCAILATGSIWRLQYPIVITGPIWRTVVHATLIDCIDSIRS